RACPRPRRPSATSGRGPGRAPTSAKPRIGDPIGSREAATPSVAAKRRPQGRPRRRLFPRPPAGAGGLFACDTIDAPMNDDWKICALCRNLETVESGREFEGIADTEYMVFRCKVLGWTTREDYLMKPAPAALEKPEPFH